MSFALSNSPVKIVILSPVDISVSYIERFNISQRSLDFVRYRMVPDFARDDR